jgi:hypothetical protein
MTPNVPKAVRPGKREMDQFGPKMRALIPRHRAFVSEYVRLGQAAPAARAAGYQAGPQSFARNGKGKGSGLRSQASRLLDRKDVADAIVEEATRRLATQLPLNLALVQRLADGSAGNDDHPVRHNIRLKALELMIDRGGLGPKLQVEHTGEVVVTVRERWERIARMAAARGEDPQALLANLPEPERLSIMGAIQTEMAGPVVEAEFEEVTEHSLSQE